MQIYDIKGFLSNNCVKAMPYNLLLEAVAIESVMAVAVGFKGKKDVSRKRSGLIQNKCINCIFIMVSKS